MKIIVAPDKFKEVANIGGLIISKLDGTAKAGVVVALMRKQLGALFHLSRGETYDAKRLFDVKRLNVRPIQARVTHQAEAEV